ncbi:MAG TPA: translesion error-prone DNA polymerase V autoproteolytic subunit [Chitinophagaceae bacterium]|jgi:DNA polymerase V|nr:translesion error-prone DNA polymerase V autoproteolytic subunit [Chitinophagaceae bacterium]
MDTNPFTHSNKGPHKRITENEKRPEDYGAEEYTEKGIDLNEQLIRNKPATFFMRVNSDAMQQSGIHQGDVIIVDRSLTAKSGKVIVALLNGEMLVRRFEKSFNKIRLVPDTPKLAPIDVDPFSEFSVWGVVTFVIHEV